MPPSRSLLTLKPQPLLWLASPTITTPSSGSAHLHATTRQYAVSSSSSDSKRKPYSIPGPFPTPSLTTTTRPAWKDLSTTGKLGRTTRATSDSLIILLGGSLVIGVAYVLYSEIFQRDSKWAWFSRGVSRIKSDTRCTELLGRASSIAAHGDTGGGGWGIRDRGISSRTELDGSGREHIHMVFTVEGERATGKVHLSVVQRTVEDKHDFKYELLCLDVPGHQTVFLEDHRAILGLEGKKSAPAKKVLGIQWGW